MSEKKEKKTPEKPVSQADANALAGIAALAAAIFALDEPAEIADVPPEQRALCAGATRKCRYIWRMEA